MLNEKEAFLIEKNGVHYQFSVSHGQLILKKNSTGKISFALNSQEIIRKHWLISDIDEEAKSLIALFYAVTHSDSDRMKLKVK